MDTKLTGLLRAARADRRLKSRGFASAMKRLMNTTDTPLN
jgi:hypothetical protein